MMRHHTATPSAAPSPASSRLLPALGPSGARRRPVRKLNAAGVDIIESRGKGGHVVARYGDREITIPIHGRRDIGPEAMRSAGPAQAALAETLRCEPRRVRRLLDLDQRSRLDQLEAALAARKRLVLEVRDAAWPRPWAWSWASPKSASSSRPT